jgi:hypothetical protein
MHICSLVECLKEEEIMVKQSFGDEKASRLISDINHYFQIPEVYIRPLLERPKLNEVNLFQSIPVVDLCELHGRSRKSVIEQIRRACKEDGFFQVMFLIWSYNYYLTNTLGGFL